MVWCQKCILLRHWDWRQTQTLNENFMQMKWFMYLMIIPCRRRCNPNFSGKKEILFDMHINNNNSEMNAREGGKMQFLNAKYGL